MWVLCVMFATGSKFSKGGVAIYAKDNLNTTKRDDLIEISDSFEAIWIENQYGQNKKHNLWLRL